MGRWQTARGVPALAFVLAASVPGEAFAAGAAYQVDTAEVSAPGSCKVESWASFAANHDFFGALAPACVVDLLRPVDVSAQFSRARLDDEWSSVVVPKLKTNLIPGAVGQWGVAVTGSAAVDLATGDLLGWSVNVPATLRLSDVVRVNLNAGLLRDRTAGRDYFIYGAAFDWRTPDNVWTLTAEIFGQAGALSADDERFVIRPRWQVGLRWRPVDDFNVDVIYGRNLYGENANWITLATVFRFKPADK